MTAPLRSAGPRSPAHGAAVRVADGILWARLPLPMAGLEHVNLYALDDGPAWTLVDTGLDWAAGRAALDALLAGPLGGKPVARVILTHHHPDHVGLLGHLAGRGADVLASRIAWLMARMLTLDPQDRPTPEQIAFRRRAGVTGAALAAYAAERPFNFADCVAPMPLGYRALEEGDRIEAGGRAWRVRLDDGHAPAHATLWSEDGEVLLAGDHVLPTISPNIGVYPTEPEADPLGGYLESLTRFAGLEADPLVLPGHGRPFRGLAGRLVALVAEHESALGRIEALLRDGERTALGLFDAIYGRPIPETETGLALVEAVAHVNRLHRAGRISRREGAEGEWLWRPA